jgi:hypothetical protein
MPNIGTSTECERIERPVEADDTDPRPDDGRTI